MSAIDATFIRAKMTAGLVLAFLSACTAKEGREPVDTGPAAGPTSTPQADSSAGPESIPDSSGQPEIPFDGSKPEALPTVSGAAGGKTAQPAVGESLQARVFDIYRELRSGTFVCGEGK